MDNIVAFFTFVLFIIFTASFTVDESITSADSNIFLPADNVTSDSVETSAANRRTEPQKIANNSTPHTNFSRFRPINSHFNKKNSRRSKQIGTRPRTCRRHSQYRISGGNDAETSDDSRSESSRSEDPSNWLKIKRDYGSRVDRKNQRNNDENVIKTKNVIDREKLKNLISEKKQKSRVEVNVLTKSIRKFLKHTFD